MQAYNFKLSILPKHRAEAVAAGMELVCEVSVYAQTADAAFAQVVAAYPEYKVSAV